MADERINQYYKLLFISVLFSSICLLDTIYVMASGIAPPSIEGNPINRQLFEKGLYTRVVFNWGVVWFMAVLLLRFAEKKLNGQIYVKATILTISFISSVDLSTHILFWITRLLP